MSLRAANTDFPCIEDVLNTYGNIPNLTKLAMGSVRWNPPQKALGLLMERVTEVSVHKYGDLNGIEELRGHIAQMLHRKGLDMTTLKVCATAGANQAFVNVAMALCNEGDNALLIAPYFYCHKMTLQLVGANIHSCDFDASTFSPDFVRLEQMIAELNPKLVVLTTPNNPSGYVYSHAEIERLVQLCRSANTWLVVDQTYYEFLYDDAVHTFPCGSPQRFDYDKIIHILSFSKIFGMPGWRVGYLVYPAVLDYDMQKIQDTVPVHAAILSQHLALHCLQLHYPLDSQHPAHIGAPAASNYSEWAASTVGTLTAVRAAVYEVVKPLGTVYTKGAFYFLVPVPAKVGENEAIHILATEFGVLLTPGSAFGAPQHMRLSYGSIPPDKVPGAVQKLAAGVKHLLELSASRLELSASRL